MANFLRWIPEKEQFKRQLALDAALFSRPFNQDDLAAFTYLPENELPSLYSWLIAQPFVQSQNGRYSYHDLAREIFSRHLYQRSKKGYYGTRRALTNHYQRLLEEIQIEEGEEAYRSAEWLELALEVAHQLFLLPDEDSHIQAIKQILYAYDPTDIEQTGEIARVLRELSQEQSNEQVNSSAQQIAKQLLRLIEADTKSKERLAAASYLLEKVSHKTAFPPELQARIYQIRSKLYRSLNEYQQAIDDCNCTLELDPNDAKAYQNRGFSYMKLHDYQQGIANLDRALELDPKDAWAYSWRGVCYRELQNYQQAITDLNHALELDPNFARAYLHLGTVYQMLHEYRQALTYFDRALELSAKEDWTYFKIHRERGFTYMKLDDYPQAIIDFDQALKMDPQDAWAHLYRGISHTNLQNYQQAITDLNHALKLDPKLAQAYFQRGSIYLLLKDTDQAIDDFACSWKLDPTDVNSGWMTEWTKMCVKRPDPSYAERLEAIAAVNPQCYEAYVCRGVAIWLRKHYEDTLAELEQAIQVGSEEWWWDSHFWKGMTYASLGRDEEATTAIEKALELELPPILLTPLRWFEHTRPDFYQQYVVPLMARYNLV